LAVSVLHAAVQYSTASQGGPLTTRCAEVEQSSGEVGMSVAAQFTSRSPSFYCVPARICLLLLSRLPIAVVS